MIETLSIPYILTLAAVDAVNPCAIAVLTLMLIAIMTYNPKDTKRILFSGLSFVAAVFILYMFYGFLLVSFFSAMQAISGVRVVLYTALGAVAIILGFLNLKDYFRYKPGGFMTEMPLSMRPRVKKLINSVTGPGGAFIVGVFVTLFLLPCTIGPYVIANGLLSKIGIFAAVPWLVLYNIVFVMPMLAITLIVYKGISTVQDVSGWKEKNIKYLHLIAGALMVIIGLAIVFELL
ncbi:MAG: hypothetical protein GXO64_02405 [Candidatus Micrarchaeota archaeon]|nr:hypothetical protein [Candidatus Micrarchaeota archaeon]